MEKITLEDHLNNILYAIDNCELKGKDHRNIMTSFIAIRDILIPKEEKPAKEIKEEPTILP